jgi:hypothetical protein
MRTFALLALVPMLCLAGEPVPAPAQAAAENAPVSAETTVVGTRDETELTPVGAYEQPKWTDRRRFPGVRLYVAPPGAATFEFWLEGKVTSDAEPARLRSMFEVSFGLGHRLQVDLYLRTESDGADVLRLESERIELRWALADWGVLWGNPTLYLEYIRQTEGPHKAEVKVLLGGAVSSRLFWGLNLFFESELWGAQTHEYGVVAGLAYSLLDSKLSIGAETNVEIIDTRFARFSPLEIEWLIGPTLSWRPVPQAHLLLTAYAGPGFFRGAAADSFAAHFVFQPTLVMGWRL